MDPPDIFEAVICYVVGLAGHRAGWPWAESICRDRASIVARAGLYQRVDNLQPEKKIAPPAAVGTKNKKKQTFFLFSPTAAIRGIFRLFFESNIFERKP